MSIPGERLKTYRESNFDEVILKIKYGVIKAGRFSHLVKVDKNIKVPRKGVLFDERSDSKSS